MNSNRSLREIFVEAAEIEDPAVRADFLDRECGADLSFRRRVEDLLAADEARGAPPEAAATDGHGPRVGSSIGPYRLLERIGEGGCGIVYMAEQEQPVRRRVALKVIKWGMDTRQVVARFEAERQALAMMNHAGIARVFDGGATEAGRPYFVMELVHGLSITDYCDRHRLPPRQRMELFIQVCAAVQHAHQKGIIHRDLKPSNILVTELDGQTQPKIIDFGIAKAIEGRLTELTLFTAFEQFLGTPAYMSPEQTISPTTDVDTRSDIYSLGVLLYELLTGETPFDTREVVVSGIDEIRRTIREVDPPRPSTRLSAMNRAELTTVARSRMSEAPRLVHLVRGDLDWIVMRCLEKDRGRRYDTANSLALDVRRHLDHKPVLACPPGRLYLLRKSVRRHKLAYGSGLLVAGALAVGLSIAAWQYAEKGVTLARAVAAEGEQSRLRAEAERQAELLRVRNYASDMNAASRALQLRDYGRLRGLLDRHRPVDGQKDLRGWEWRYLWQQAQSDARAQLCSRGSQIISLASSPDGRWLATGTAHEGGLLLLDLEDPGTTIRLAEDSERVQAVFSPLESLLVFTTVQQREDGRRESILHLWDPAAQRMRVSHTLEAGYECVGLAMARDGKRVLTSISNGSEGFIGCWELPEAVPLFSVPSRQFSSELSPEGFAATPDLRWVAYSERREIVVVDLEGRTERTWALDEAPQYVTALSFSPDGSRLAAAFFGDPDIHLWDVESGRRLPSLEGHESFVAALRFSPDGMRIFSGGGDRTIGVWEVESGRRVETLVGHEHTIWRVHLLPDGHTLVSGCRDGTILSWDLDEIRAERGAVRFPVQVEDWRFAAGGKAIVTIDRDRSVLRWSGGRFGESKEILALGPDDPVSRIASFTEDGRLLVATSPEGECTVIDLEDPSRRQRFGKAPGSFKLPALFLGTEWLVEPIRENQDGELQALEISRVESGEQVLSLPPIPTLVNSLYDPNRRAFVQFGLNGQLRLTPLDGGSSTDLRLDYHEGSWSAALSPDGRLLAIPSYLGYVRVWDTRSWTEIATLDGFLLGVNSAVFSPDGGRLLVGGEVLPEESLRLFDTASWNDVLTLQAEGAHFMLTRISPDGNSLGTNDSLGSLQVWQAPGWEEIAEREGADPGWIGQARP